MHKKQLKTNKQTNKTKNKQKHTHQNMCTVRKILHQTDILFNKKPESTVGLFLTALNESEERTTLPRLSGGTVVTLYAQGIF